jgi:predicted Zn-dependent peptidase
MIRPSEATLVAVGDCDHETVHRLAAEAFAGWEGAAGASAPIEGSRPDPPRLNVVPRPGAPQSELRIGHVAVPRSTPDYFPLVVANTILGGQFVSRINLNLREDKGFTYGARTSFDFRRLAGPFALQVSVATPATVRAIEESLAEISGIRGPKAVTPEELVLGVAALTRGYARNFETAEQVARAVAQVALFDLDDDYYSQFVACVEGVTIDDVTGAAVKHLHPDRLAVLIVGDLDKISGDLPELAPGLGIPTILSAESF